MKRMLSSARLIRYFYNKNVYFSVFIVLVLYCLTLLIENHSNEKNIYDLFIEITRFHSLSYLIIPTFLIVLTVYFSQGKVQNYLAFRFQNKKQWYHMNLVCIAQLTIGFLLIVVAIMLVQSLFVFSFKNKWSDFALNYYTYHSDFLMNFSPFAYSIATFILVGLHLFLFGLIFYFIFIWTRNPMISLLFVILLNVMNIAITLGKLDSLAPFFFTDHVNIMQYIYKFDLNQYSFPYSIFIYWLILILIIYSISRFLLDRVDFDVEKGEKKDVS
ncbi:hypothetical protein [Gracilibacillus alcaliphilus]|uniref:hypothetical protein n=1 Tax=Gracilibacillus alcaliphilus TaxID=1401441 RepID=UPI00195E4BDF|nr:hypothetical protein [Gracilibacillus alcaliphilus]MBM7678286.1 hypothetical protein [Gracilibacillus alcaliphilus]